MMTRPVLTRWADKPANRSKKESPTRCLPQSIPKPCSS
jgi:hypothetical protein